MTTPNEQQNQPNKEEDLWGEMNLSHVQGETQLVPIPEDESCESGACKI